MKSLINHKIVTLIVLSGMLFTQIAFAYEVEKLSEASNNLGDFVVGPGKIELNLKPGEQRTIPIKISNRLGETKSFNLDVEDFTGSNDPKETVVLLGDQRGPYSLRDFISFEEPNFTLNAGERATIPVTISVPADAEPGGLYGTLLVSVVTSPSAEGRSSGGSAIVSRIGTLFFVTVPGDVNKVGEVVDFGTTGKKRFFGKGPINFEILFKNDSSVHLNPYGVVSVKNMYGEEVASIVADPWFALPQSLRLRELTWNREFLFGKYTAKAEINRGYDNIVDTKEFTFYVLPWKIALAVIPGLAIVIFFIRVVSTKFEIRKKS